MLDNLPPGAANDPCAPYNEPLSKEAVYDYEIVLKGAVFIPYYNEDDLEDKTDEAKRSLSFITEKMEDRLSELLVNSGIDIAFNESRFEYW